jgi:hypothetical protein
MRYVTQAYGNRDMPGTVLTSDDDEHATRLIFDLDIVGLAQLPRGRPSSWSGAFQNELLDLGANRPIVHPPPHPPALHVAAVMMVKDEADIVAMNLRWLCRSGFRRFVIIENASTDGTRQAICNFRANHLDCEVVIVDDPLVRFMQAQTTTGGLRLAMSFWPDVRWVFFIDADEFLITQYDLAALDRVPDDVECIVLPKAVHFRERSGHRFEDEGRQPFWREMTLRSYLFFVPPKIAVRASANIFIHQGNHFASRDDGAEMICVGGLGLGLCYREFQTRSFAHFRRKAISGTAALRAADAHTGAVTVGRHWELWNDLRDQQSDAEFRDTYRLYHLRDAGGNIVVDPFPLLGLLKNF